MKSYTVDGEDEGLREAARAVVDARPMDWSVPPLHPDHIEVHENAFDALMDAIDALERVLEVK
jgi:hypothetical protein